MVIEVEADNAQNANVVIDPLGGTLRGGFRAERVRMDEAGRLAMRLPGGVPGQRLRIDTASATATVVEPLADPANKPLRDTLARIVTNDESADEKRLKFDEPTRVITGIDVPTWIGWLVRLTRAGWLKVTAGQLPAEVPADAKPRQSGQAQDPRDQTIQQLTALLMARLTPAEKRELGLAGK